MRNPNAVDMNQTPNAMSNQSMHIEMPTKVLNLVNAYLTKAAKTNIFNEASKQLAVSLYAKKREANASKEVVNALGTYVINLDQFFSQHEQGLLLDNYAAVVEFCLDDYNKSVMISRSTGMSSQPKELTQFIIQVMDVQTGSDVYLPFAGLCSEATELNGCHIDGEEIWPEAWALGQIRLDARSVEADIRLGDSFPTLMQGDGKRYDAIMFNPPMALRYANDYRKSEMDAVLYAFENKLKDGGKMCCVLSPSFLFKHGKELALRQYLVGNPSLTP